MVVLQIRTRKSFQRSRNTFKVIKRNENEDQITGHLPDSQAEKTTPLMRKGSLKTVKSEGNAALWGIWTQVCGIQRNINYMGTIFLKTLLETY